MTPSDSITVAREYTNSPKLLFGKILDRYLVNAAPEYGVFQNALASAVNEYVGKVFLKKMTRGMGMTGVVTIGTSASPITIPTGTPASCCVTSFVSAPVTFIEAEAACKDPAGTWAGLFKLIATYLARGTVSLTCPACMGFFYTTSLSIVYPALISSWYAAGVAFDASLKAKQVDDHAWCFHLVSKEIDRLFTMTMTMVQPVVWPVVGGVYSGTINWSFSDISY